MYRGSKAQIAKYIVPIIQSYVKDVYIEPFVGGANVLAHITAQHRYGYDNNRWLIALFRNADKVALLPDFLSRDEFSKVREYYYYAQKNGVVCGAYEEWYVGAVGFLASFGGGFFAAGYGAAYEKTKRNMFLERKGNFLDQKQLLKGVVFECKDYRDMDIPYGATVYCDPPYAGTTPYIGSFDSIAFWQWAKEQAKRATVLVSELRCMLDESEVELLWQGKIKHGYAVRGAHTVRENLWRIK